MIRVILSIIVCAMIASSIATGTLGSIIFVVLFIGSLFGPQYLSYVLRVRSTNKARPADRQYPTISLFAFIRETVKYRFNRIIKRNVA